MISAGEASFRCLSAGDGALVVELGREIDPDINARVIALARRIEGQGLPGIREIVPTYRSLLILYDPLLTDADALEQAVSGLWPHVAGGERSAAATVGRLWRVPVLYGGAHGVDLDFIAASHDLTTDEVIALHSGARYRVYMIGFAPGFAYLGGLPATLHTSRRSDPRPKTPARSVSIGGQQTAVSPPIEVPSGWHLLGRTPVRSYDPARADRPFLFEAGDEIVFQPVNRADYDRMERAAEAGDIVAEMETPT